MSRKVQSAAVGAAIQFGKHNMSCKHLTSMDFGRIQTIHIQDCVPNDEIDLSLAEMVITTAPNPAPIQGKIKCNIAAFYVPCRVVFPEFNNVITGLSNVDIPRFDGIDINNADQAAGITEARKCDRFAHISAMGLPIDGCYRVPDSSAQGYRTMKLSILPFRAYRRIWWDWFRNTNVIPDTQASSYLYTSSSNEGVTQYFDPHYACWDKNYLTNNLSSPNGDHRTFACSSTASSSLDKRGAYFSVSSSVSSVKSSASVQDSFSNNNNVFVPVNQSIEPYLSSINSIRSSNSLQTFIEKCNVLGGRVIDRLRGMFGSSVQPETLQMSEFLGMNTFNINFETSAAPTSNINDDQQFDAFGVDNTQVGTVKGQRTGDSTMTVDGLSNIRYHVKEHGFFFILSWIMPDAIISEGISPLWLRNVDGVNPSRFDFLTPEMVNLGFEPLYSYEVALPTKPDLTLGTYNPFNAIAHRGRYSNYTYNKDIVSGCFSNPSTRGSMRNWLLSRSILREAGLLNQDGSWSASKTGTDFVNGISFDTLPYMTSSSRQAYDDKFTFSSNSQDHFVVQANINLQMIRPLASTVVPRIETVAAAPHEFGGSRL